MLDRSPPPTTVSPPDQAGPGRSAHPAARAAGYAIGVALLTAALAVVWRRRDTVVAAIETADDVSAGPVALLLGGVVANVVLSGLFLRTLLARYGRVGMLEMQAIAAAATLMNFLPLRPGLFGRVAYHRAVNGIAIADTARTVVEGAVISLLVGVYLAGAAALAADAGPALWLPVLGPIPILAAVAGVARVRPWALAALLKYLEVLVWALRYHAAFVLIGSPIGMTASLAFACVSLITTMVPFVGNGLGLREWAVGLLAPILTGHRLELGVTAELVNRGAEIVVLGILGTVAMVWLGHRLRAARAAVPEQRDPGAAVR